MFCLLVLVSFFFFFRQKTAYAMHISDWSSDVCSSDLRIMFILSDPVEHIRGSAILTARMNEAGKNVAVSPLHVKPGDLGAAIAAIRLFHNVAGFRDRKSVEYGKSVAVLVVSGGVSNL